MRARLLFFILAGLTSLVLCMGLFGPLFPALRRVVPLLSGMRAPVRFYYIFALCLPILFVLSCASLRGLPARVPHLTVPAKRLLAIAVPALAVTAVVMDFSPYLALYHHRVLDKESYNRLCSFIEERTVEDRAGVLRSRPHPGSPGTGGAAGPHRPTLSREQWPVHHRDGGIMGAVEPV